MKNLYNLLNFFNTIDQNQVNLLKKVIREINDLSIFSIEYRTRDVKKNNSVMEEKVEMQKRIREGTVTV